LIKRKSRRTASDVVANRIVTEVGFVFDTIVMSPDVWSMDHVNDGRGTPISTPCWNATKLGTRVSRPVASLCSALAIISRFNSPGMSDMGGHHHQSSSGMKNCAQRRTHNNCPKETQEQGRTLRCAIETRKPSSQHWHKASAYLIAWSARTTEQVKTSPSWGGIKHKPMQPRTISSTTTAHTAAVSTHQWRR
jgi:hypothetical protein